MSAYRDSLTPEARAVYDERIAAAARILGRARARRDALPARQAAEAAYVPGGPSVDELEALILRHRAEAAAQANDTKTTEEAA